MTEQTPKTYLPADMQQIATFAQDSSGCGFFGLTPQQAIVQLIAGRDLGMSPTGALMGIYQVKGKLQVSGQALRGIVQNHPRFDLRVIENTLEAGAVEFFEIVNGNRESLGVCRFTMEDAKRAKLLGNQTWA